MYAELEKVAQQEGSEIRPLAKFQPIPVAHYIRHCLADSTLSPFLSFGPSQTSIEENAQLREAQAWYAALRTTPAEGEEEFEGMMKRMKEELRGQADAAMVGISTREERTRPQHGAKRLSVPQSVPALLHLLAGVVARGMEEAIQRVGGGAILEREEVVGSMEKGEGGKVLVRERVVGEVSSALDGALVVADFVGVGCEWGAVQRLGQRRLAYVIALTRLASLADLFALSVHLPKTSSQQRSRTPRVLRHLVGS